MMDKTRAGIFAGSVFLSINKSLVSKGKNQNGTHGFNAALIKDSIFNAD